MNGDGSGPVRVVLVEDHPVYREGLRLLLTAHEGIEVVGECGDGAAGLELVRATRPDVVVLDLDLPERSGQEVLEELRSAGSQVAVLVLTMHGQDSRLAAALGAGARGYLVKDSGPEAVVRAVRALADGQAILGSSVAARGIAMAASAGGPTVLPELTEREREVLAEMARGADNHTIAEQLGLSVKTVRNVVSSIYTKLGTATRAHAVVRAHAAGLLD